MCCWFEFGCPHYCWLLHAVTPSWGSSNSPDPLLLSIVIYCLLPQLAAHFGNGLSSKKPPVFSWSGDSTVGIVLTAKQWIGVAKNDRKMGVEYLTSKEFDSFYYNKKNIFTDLLGLPKHQNTASRYHWPGALDPPSRQQMHPQLLGGSKLRESVSKWGIPEITMTFGHLMVSYNKSQIVLV